VGLDKGISSMCCGGCVCGSVHVPYYVLLAAFNEGITHDGPVNGLYCDMFTG
jgi:hypothetical protein